jgi:hypothetical protein
MPAPTRYSIPQRPSSACAFTCASSADMCPERGNCNLHANLSVSISTAKPAHDGVGGRSIIGNKHLQAQHMHLKPAIIHAHSTWKQQHAILPTRPEQYSTVDASLLLSSELALHKMRKSLLRPSRSSRPSHPASALSLLSGSSILFLPTPPWTSALIPKSLWTLSQQYADSSHLCPHCLSRIHQQNPPAHTQLPSPHLHRAVQGWV